MQRPAGGRTDGQVAGAPGAQCEQSKAPWGRGLAAGLSGSAQASGAMGRGVGRGVGDRAGLTGCSPCQQRPLERHLVHQGEPFEQ